MKLKFNKEYILYFLILLNIEIAIALFSHTPFIRYFLGDVLVVALIYTFIQSFFTFSYNKTIIGILLFAFLIEIFQYYNIVDIVGLQNNTLVKIVLGTTFSYSDLIAYSFGAILVYAIEKRIFIL